jgi:CelD/BcsL family acetyltransferase involved in cellulose biosynthesis
MQHYIWSESCIGELVKASAVRIVTVGDPSAPEAIAPMAVRGKISGRLEMLGVDMLHEPMDLMYRDHAALSQLAAVLAELRAPLVFRRLPAASPAAAVLSDALRPRAFVVRRTAPGCPFIALDPSWAEPEKHYNAGRRSDFRRMLRNAERMGEVTYEIASPKLDTLQSMLDEAFAVECANWKGEEGTALSHDAARGGFFRRYAAAAAERGILRLCFMRIGGKAAAMQFAIESGGGFWLLKIGYDYAFSRCSPGSLLMLRTIRHAAQAGLASYEFLGAPAAWTAGWTDTLHPCEMLLSYPRNYRGAAAFIEDGARYAVRELQARLRKLL